MSRHVSAIAILTVILANAARADTIDRCSLLVETELVELGLPKDSVPLQESQPGGVRVCRYQSQTSPTTADGMVSIILSQAVPERVLQLRGLQAKSRDEGTQAEQQARGEYFEGGVMCKVVSAAQRQISQCIGATEQSVVALTTSQPSAAEVVYPASQLRLLATLVSRVRSRGG